MYRSDVGDTVRRILVEVEQAEGAVNLYDGSMPEFVNRTAARYETEEVASEAWRCSKIRLLGQCSTTQVLFPDEKYL